MISVALAVALSTHKIDYRSTEIEIETLIPVTEVKISEVSNIQIELSETQCTEIDIEIPEILTDIETLEQQIEVGG